MVVHHHATIAFLSLAMAAMLLPCAGCSQTSIHEHSDSLVHLKIGDSAQSVRRTLGVSEAPALTHGGDQSVAGEIRLPERGIWVFFNDQGLASQYRFDAPFSGEIHGAKIGASIEDIRELWGVPIRELPGSRAGPPGTSAYLYRADPDTTIRCDFEWYKLATIRVLTGTVTLGAHKTKNGELPGVRQQIASARPLPKTTNARGFPRSPAVTQQSTGSAPPHLQTTDQPRVPEAHQRIATGPQAAGQLAATPTPGCISIEQVRSNYTAADLYRFTRQCLDADQYDLAAPLFVLAGGYGRFDAMRVVDKTAGQGITILIESVGEGLTDLQKQGFLAAMRKTHDDPIEHTRVCARIIRIGPPDYIPVYLIDYGIGLQDGQISDANGLDPDFDPAKTWTLLLSEGMLCPWSLLDGHPQQLRSETQ